MSCSGGVFPPAGNSLLCNRRAPMYAVLITTLPWNCSMAFGLWRRKMKRPGNWCRGNHARPHVEYLEGRCLPSGGVFADNFNYPNGLITNEYAYWNPSDPRAVQSPLWEMTSGSLF